MNGPARRSLGSEHADALVRWSANGTDAAADTQQAHAPTPDPACLYGLVGDVAFEGSDGSETNPIAIAGNFLAYLSCAIGRAPYLAVGNTNHHPRIFFLHVGRSGRGRKGDAVSLVLRIDEALRTQANDLAPQIHRGGLSSREGLAALIHDGYRIGQQEVPAIEDKRLWVVESEFANVLQQSRRGGNTLSAALRDCWDGVDLKPATKSNQVHATAPHVCLSGAISPVELLSLVQQRDLLNGFANRFLLVWGERTQIQPFPKRTPQARMEALARRVAKVLAFVREETKQGSDPMLVVMAEAARSRYAELYQTELNQDLGNTLVDNVLERRAPMLLRLAMILALADLQWQIEVQHVEAAMAWIRYATDSARFVFANGSGGPSEPHIAWAAQRISEFLTVRGSASRRDLVVDCFGRHQPAVVVDAAIAHLIEQAPSKVCVEVRARSKGGPGRPATVYSLARN